MFVLVPAIFCFLMTLPHSLHGVQWDIGCTQKPPSAMKPVDILMIVDVCYALDARVKQAFINLTSSIANEWPINPSNIQMAIVRIESGPGWNAAGKVPNMGKMENGKSLEKFLIIDNINHSCHDFDRTYELARAAKQQMGDWPRTFAPKIVVYFRTYGEDPNYISTIKPGPFDGIFTSKPGRNPKDLEKMIDLKFEFLTEGGPYNTAHAKITPYHNGEEKKSHEMSLNSAASSLLIRLVHLSCLCDYAVKYSSPCESYAGMCMTSATYETLTRGKEKCPSSGGRLFCPDAYGCNSTTTTEETTTNDRDQYTSSPGQNRNETQQLADVGTTINSTFSVAVGVSTVIGLLVVSALVMIFLRRRRRRRRQRSSSRSGPGRSRGGRKPQHLTTGDSSSSSILTMSELSKSKYGSGQSVKPWTFSAPPSLTNGSVNAVMSKDRQTERDSPSPDSFNSKSALHAKTMFSGRDSGRDVSIANSNTSFITDRSSLHGLTINSYNTSNNPSLVTLSQMSKEIGGKSDACLNKRRPT